MAQLDVLIRNAKIVDGTGARGATAKSPYAASGLSKWPRRAFRERRG